MAKAVKYNSLRLTSGIAFAPHAEVKSANSFATYLDGIANAYAQRGQNYVIMHATDDCIAPEGHEFVRGRINYALSYDEDGEGTDATTGKTYTFAASIYLYRQDEYQYLYTWV